MSDSTFFDYDLFIFLPDLRIHIATAGAKIPGRLIDLVGNNLDIYSHYQNSEVRYEVEVNPRLDEIVYSREREQNVNFTPEQYLYSFKKFASQGFYSFDKTNIGQPLDTDYHLVAYPSNLSTDFKNPIRFVESRANLKISDKNEVLLSILLKMISNKDYFPNKLVY